MYKALSSIFAVMLFVTAVPATSLAATSTVSASVQAQLDLLVQLQKQVNSLLQQLQAVQQQKQQIISQLVDTLKQGSQGDQVLALQALLAADPSIYPEGKITGFFGALTGKAVKRFQEKNGLPSVGFVGPLTRSKLNKLLEDNPLGHENDREGSSSAPSAGRGDNENEGHGHLCVIVPPGHFIAPGWLRKNDGVRPLIPECQTLPPGILQKLNATSTHDLIAPVVSSVVVVGAGTSTATVTWVTNEPANSQIAYGVTSAYGSSTVLDGTLVTSHSQMIMGLATSTTYHFQVRSRDASGNLGASADATFATSLVSVDTVPPVISGVGASTTVNGALVTWTTNESANSQIAYGLTSAYGSSTVLDATLVTSHSQAVTGLTAGTVYHFQVSSRDGSGNLATSSDQMFTTMADVTSPAISGIGITPGTSTASVIWTTNEGATSQILYGTTTGYGFSTVLDATLVGAHSQTLTGLVPGTMYHLQIQSKDASNNLAASLDQTFTTLTLDTTPPTISSVTASPASGTASVTWTTNEAATSKVYYSTVNPVDLGSASSTSDVTLVTSHTANLTGLNASTTYFYVVQSADASLNTATSSQQSFTTGS